MTSFGASLPDDKINRKINELLLAKVSTSDISIKLHLDEEIIKKKRFAILFVKSREIPLIKLREMYDLTTTELQQFSKLGKQFGKLAKCIQERTSEPEPMI